MSHEEIPVVHASQLDDIFRSKLGAVHTEIQEQQGSCGASFDVTIVSPEFKGLSQLQRHRKVYAALKEEMKSIHAFIQKSYTPEEWAKQTDSKR